MTSSFILFRAMHDEPGPRLEELLRHTRWVEELARRLVRDPSAAQDLAQSAWVLALESAERPRSNLRGWLGTLVRNLARERHRREAQRPAVERSGARTEALPSPLELVGRAEAERKLVESVLQLEEPHRTTLLLRYFEALSPAEIARREGVEPATVAHRLTRAHQRLRERLGQREGGAGWLAALAPILQRPAVRHAPWRPIMSTTTKLVLASIALSGLALLVVWRRPGAASPEPVARTAQPAAQPARDAELALVQPDSQRSGVPAAREEPAPQARPPAAAASAAPAPASAPDARIHGRVERPDAQPASGRRVRLVNLAPTPGQGAGEIFVACDGAGRFEASELRAGVWSVSTWPDEAELATLGIDADGALGGMAYLAERTIDLAPRGDVELLLGAPPSKPIRVHGHVLRAGASARPFAIQWLPEGEGTYDLKKNARVLPDGTYDVTLERPGTYYVTAILDGVRPEWTMRVPDERELVLDLRVEPLVLEGRVVGSGDRGIAQATVELSVHAGRRAPLLMSSLALSTRTDAEGRFCFRGLPDAGYVVHAYGGELGDAHAPGGARASRVVRPRAPGEKPELVIELEPGVRVPVRVVDTAGAEKLATVFVFDAQGEPLDPASLALSGKEKPPRLPPLAPGRYAVVAANGNAWSAPHELEIVAGAEPAPIELQLEPAALLEVDASACGAALIEACDEGGRRFGCVIDRARFNRAIERDWNCDRPLLRLPAGNYVIRAQGLDGELASVRVGLVAGDTRRILLKP